MSDRDSPGVRDAVRGVVIRGCKLSTGIKNDEAPVL
jgi:hypothetical protein